MMVKSESSNSHDEKINKVAVEGTQNVLDSIPDKCKIIMPSTHVIFEGLESVKKNLIEIIVGYKKY